MAPYDDTRRSMSRTKADIFASDLRRIPGVTVQHASRTPNDHGWILRPKGGAVITIYDTGSMDLAGTPNKPVNRLYNRHLESVTEKGHDKCGRHVVRHLQGGVRRTDRDSELEQLRAQNRKLKLALSTVLQLD